jgi:transcriptional regulator EpsA
MSSSSSITLPDVDPAQFLKIAGQGATLRTHADLWRWLQGDVQLWLPHDILLVGWGDFRSGELQYDVISSLPGLRTHLCPPQRISPLVNYFRDCWVAAQSQPCQLDISGCGQLLGEAGQGWAPAPGVPGMQTALVHGVGDGRLGGERIFAALSADLAPAGGAGALKLLVPFIDSALRRMPPAPMRQPGAERNQVEQLVVRLGQLSERERQIMVWVAMGKTNPEIGCILHISEFTVKNHMKSIFSKLDVTNRAQAVAKLTRMAAYA